ncbi:microphthalmia-associated transcription factor-like [Ruditapes philippinarum]|uniref:microphthalmia-associated transcription factor-like n=1 Tax=Ruditapes philippinarum TaxID=129788 RepID=UPI00295BA647|nr:microphthalmia-associated transcription factor-like [Ruditapes philippinarum]
MSDYFSNRYRYAQNYITDFERHIEQMRDDLKFHIKETGTRERYHGFNQSYHDLLRFDMLSRGGQELPERKDIHHIDRLEQLSSSLVQLLSTARHNAKQRYNSQDTVHSPANDRFWTHMNSREFENRQEKHQAFAFNPNHRACVEVKRRERHNKVERRRRSIINERITEIRNLLPEDINRATLGRKSVVLKEAIDYIKQLQKVIANVHQLEDKMETICSDVNTISEKLERLEMQTAGTVPTHNKQNIKTSESFENSNVSSDTAMTYEYIDGDEKSILSLPQHIFQENTTSSFDLDDVWDDIRTSLSVDTSISLQSSLGLEFDEQSYILSDTDIASDVGMVT